MIFQIYFWSVQIIMYLYDVMCIVLCSVPAAQTHTTVHRTPPWTRLGCKQEVLWVEVVCGCQGDVRRCKTVQVPVNTNAVDITCCLYVTQNLQQGREVDFYHHLHLNKHLPIPLFVHPSSFTTFAQCGSRTRLSSRIIRRVLEKDEEWSAGPKSRAIQSRCVSGVKPKAWKL